MLYIFHDVRVACCMQLNYIKKQTNKQKQKNIRWKEREREREKKKKVYRDLNSGPQAQAEDCTQSVLAREFA